MFLSQAIVDGRQADDHTARSMCERYLAVRHRTEALCEPLETEDYVVSSMPDVSPVKWHLAHTSWFFETFVLGPHDAAYRSLDGRYAFLFNSYYVQAGERHCRAQRGLATRPTVAQVFEYREHVDEAMVRLLAAVAGDPDHPAAGLIELGIQHEQQHQELMLSDIKHVFWINPLRPRYRPAAAAPAPQRPTARWLARDGGIVHVGHDGSGFAFDNERPRHRVFIEPFLIASRLVTNGEYQEFVDDGGYQRAPLWLSNGHAAVQAGGWEVPLYWERTRDGWSEFTLAGSRILEGGALDEPVRHVSFYEADAYARWAGSRLPTEFEWETAAMDGDGRDAVDGQRCHPLAADSGAPLAQLFGEAWQWTGSAYVGYPGFAAAGGAIGEYNGKWMADQWVLRGSSFATAPSHARPTYRNFFPSDARWQFSGIRLARHADAPA